MATGSSSPAFASSPFRRQSDRLRAGAVNTVFTGEVKDQSQLYGLLDRLLDLGLELISVQPQTEAGRATDEDQTAR